MPRPLAALTRCAVIGGIVASGYDYSDIVAQYCHEDLDWGPLPARPDQATELLQVQVFVRHGSRVLCSADYCWQGDNEGNYTCDIDYLVNSVEKPEGSPLGPAMRTEYTGQNLLPGNCLLGQLVASGYEMERRNGLRLREAYVDREHFLPPVLDRATEKSAFVLRSTDVPRTKQSAMGLMSGLYTEEQTVSLPYMSLRTQDMEKETMIANPSLCPAISWRSQTYARSLPKEQLFELQALCQQFNPNKTNPMDCYLWLTHLVDCLMSRVCPTVPFSPRNSTVPTDFLKDDAALLRRVWKVTDEVQWGWFGALQEVGAWHQLASDILGPAKLAVEGGKEAAKFLLFSGHDTGPMEVLYKMFQLRDQGPYWPAFASMIVLELWSSPSGPVARWILNGKVVAGPMPFRNLSTQLEAVVATQAACHSPPPSTQRTDYVQLDSSLRSQVGPWQLSVVASLSAVAGALFALAAMATWWRWLPARTTQERAGQEVSSHFSELAADLRQDREIVPDGI